MIHTPLISIIIPTFNRARYLKDSINSILKQTVQDFEIIIYDNASTDGTSEVIHSFEDSRIKYFRNEKTLGVVYNHNLALNKCQGKFIQIFSDDDTMLPKCLEIKLNAFEKHTNAVLIHTNINIIDSNGEICSNKHWAYQWDFTSKVFKNNELIDGEEILNYLLNHWNFISMPSVMIKGDVIRKSKLLSTKLNLFCDYGFWCEIANYGKFVYLEEKSVNYRFHDKNTINQSSFNQGFKELQLIKKMNYGKLVFYLCYPLIAMKTSKQIEFYNNQKNNLLLNRFIKKSRSIFSLKK